MSDTHYLLQARAIAGRPRPYVMIPKEALRQILSELERIPPLERAEWRLQSHINRIADFAREGLRS
jgi:hypothetical protein